MQRAFGEDVHANRVESLANAVAGTLEAAVVSIAAIGRAYATLRGTTPKAGIKQIDRMLSNDGIHMSDLLAPWARFVIAGRDEIVLTMDWTDFDDDDHTTLAVYLVTTHGRATPLWWKTVRKSELKHRRTGIEQQAVVEIDQVLEPGVRVELLADRGFGDQKLYALLDELDWGYSIRFRGNIRVEASDGRAKRADEWVPPTGRAIKLVDALVTADRHKVPAVVVVHDRKMKERWCIATSHRDRPASGTVKRYGRRFTTEETFRDQKDLRFGMGLRTTHIDDPARRDRLLFVIAIAHALLTLLGAASEAAGLDRVLKANTVRTRTHSLYFQGCHWYHALPEMRADWLADLMREYDRVVREHALFREIFGVI